MVATDPTCLPTDIPIEQISQISCLVYELEVWYFIKKRRRESGSSGPVSLTYFLAIASPRWETLASETVCVSLQTGGFDREKMQKTDGARQAGPSLSYLLSRGCCPCQP